MSSDELEAKVNSLRELRNLEAEIKAEITAIEDEIKAEMLAKNTDVLAGQNCVVSWKTILTSRFDTSAFKIAHSDLFAKYNRKTTSRRFVIA